MLRALAEAPLEVCPNHAIKTRRCAARGVALIGDAGGCSHPITASGMTVALNDIHTLATELARSGCADSARLDEALWRYQAARYEFVRAREILADALYAVFRCGEGATAVRGGLSRYWSSGCRARAASIALLSGHESRLWAFVAEYVLVVAESAVGVLGAPVKTGDPSGRRRALGGLFHIAYEQLHVATLDCAEFLRRRARPRYPLRRAAPSPERGRTWAG
jgi:hypothetical protein